MLDTLHRPARGAIVNLLVFRTEPATVVGNAEGYWYQVDLDSTDNNGRFRFDELGRGRYQVKAYGVWMEGHEESITIRRNDATISVRIPMAVREHRETPSAVRAERLAHLAAAKARWTAQRIRSYRLTAELSCFCFAGGEGPATLEFHNDSLVRVTSRRGVHGPEVLPWLNGFSIPKLFDEVDAALRDLQIYVNGVSYDATYGFPASLDTDTVYGYSDGWLRWRVKDFRPIPE